MDYVYVVLFSMTCDCELIAHETQVYHSYEDAKAYFDKCVNETKSIVEQYAWTIDEDTDNVYCAFEEGGFSHNNIVLEIHKCEIR